MQGGTDPEAASNTITLGIATMIAATSGKTAIKNFADVV